MECIIEILTNESVGRGKVLIEESNAWCETKTTFDLGGVRLNNKSNATVATSLQDLTDSYLKGAVSWNEYNRLWPLVATGTTWTSGESSDALIDETSRKKLQLHNQIAVLGWSEVEPLVPEINKNLAVAQDSAPLEHLPIATDTAAVDVFNTVQLIRERYDAGLLPFKDYCEEWAESFVAPRRTRSPLPRSLPHTPLRERVETPLILNDVQNLGASPPPPQTRKGNSTSSLSSSPTRVSTTPQKIPGSLVAKILDDITNQKLTPPDFVAPPVIEDAVLTGTSATPPNFRAIPPSLDEVTPVHPNPTPAPVPPPAVATTHNNRQDVNITEINELKVTSVSSSIASLHKASTPSPTQHRDENTSLTASPAKTSGTNAYSNSEINLSNNNTAETALSVSPTNRSISESNKTEWAHFAQAQLRTSGHIHQTLYAEVDKRIEITTTEAFSRQALYSGFMLRQLVLLEAMGRKSITQFCSSHYRDILQAAHHEMTFVSIATIEKYKREQTIVLPWALQITNYYILFRQDIESFARSAIRRDEWIARLYITRKYIEDSALSTRTDVHNQQSVEFRQLRWLHKCQIAEIASRLAIAALEKIERRLSIDSKYKAPSTMTVNHSPVSAGRPFSAASPVNNLRPYSITPTSSILGGMETPSNHNIGGGFDSYLYPVYHEESVAREHIRVVERDHWGALLRLFLLMCQQPSATISPFNSATNTLTPNEKYATTSFIPYMNGFSSSFPPYAAATNNIAPPPAQPNSNSYSNIAHIGTSPNHSPTMVVHPHHPHQPTYVWDKGGYTTTIWNEVEIGRSLYDPTGAIRTEQWK